MHLTWRMLFIALVQDKRPRVSRVPPMQINNEDETWNNI